MPAGRLYGPVRRLHRPVELLTAQRTLAGTARGLRSSCCLRQLARPLAAWTRSMAVLQTSPCGSPG